MLHRVSQPLHMRVRSSDESTDLKALLPAELREFAALAARSRDPVLLYGETGSGKTLLARLIHDLDRPSAIGEYVHVNCAAIPETLFEREMFGHVRGAFTDARDSGPGMVEAADGGTLFLDEIGELPLALQPKLLQVLEAGVVRRVGSTRSTPCSFRLLSATNRNLPKMMQEGSFREDLYFRCAVLEARLPPLRERRRELRAIANLLLTRLDSRLELDEQVAALLTAYSWPGNLRELENCLRHAAVYARGNLILPEHLPERVRQSCGSVCAPRRPAAYVAPADPREEARAITEALRAEQGNRTRAARRLGMSRATLWIKIQRHGLESSCLTGV